MSELIIPSDSFWEEDSTFHKTTFHTGEGSLVCDQITDAGGSRHLVVSNSEGKVVAQPGGDRYPFTEALVRVALEELYATGQWVDPLKDHINLTETDQT